MHEEVRAAPRRWVPPTDSPDRLLAPCAFAGRIVGGLPMMASGSAPRTPDMDVEPGSCASRGAKRWSRPESGPFVDGKRGHVRVYEFADETVSRFRHVDGEPVPGLILVEKTGFFLPLRFPADCPLFPGRNTRNRMPA